MRAVIPVKEQVRGFMNYGRNPKEYAVLRLLTLIFFLLISPLYAVKAVKAVNAAEPTATRPNIVLIFVDDLGWKDTGFTGSDFYETPNLDRLAKEGMTFKAAYASAANCAPSRACLLSGNYTPRHGVYAVGSTNRGPQQQQRLVPIPNKSGLAKENVTLADALKAGGYATGIFGKWHLGGKDGAAPKEQGFDVSMDTKGEAEEGDEGDADAGPAKKAGGDPKGIFSITKAACNFIEQNKSRPFFAYVAHHASHVPYAARPETLARFQQKRLGLPPDAQHKNALYAACIYDMDAGIGALLQKMADLGLDKNTLVVFTSDNGGAPKLSQEPLRGNKGAYYEGGIREPMIVRWPGIVGPGTHCDVPVINIDFFPTFLEASRTPVPAGKIVDGESLVPLFKGAGALQRSSIFWHFPGYLDTPVLRGRDPIFRTRPVSVIRKGDWKLFLYHEEWQLHGGRDKIDTNRAIELYNVASDSRELQNIANQDTAKRDELLKDLLAWMDQIKAPLASRLSLSRATD